MAGRSNFPRYTYSKIKENDILKRELFIKYKHLQRVLRKAITKSAYCEICTPKRGIPGKKYLNRCIRIHPQFVTLKANSFGVMWEIFNEKNGTKEDPGRTVEQNMVGNEVKQEEELSPIEVLQ